MDFMDSEHPLLLDLDEDGGDNNSNGELYCSAHMNLKEIIKMVNDSMSVADEDEDGGGAVGSSIAEHKAVVEKKSGFFSRKKSSTTNNSTMASDKPDNKKSSSPIEIQGTSPHHQQKVKGQQNIPGENKGKISFFRVLTRRNSATNQGKHKKLDDQWLEGQDVVLDGISFSVKFLGSTLTDGTGATDAADAIKTVMQMVKIGQKTLRLGLCVSPKGITLSDPQTGEVRLEISIYDIAHCSTDSHYPNVFTFIGTNKNDVNECYCFATNKRKMAQHITMTIAQSFNVAYEQWQSSSSMESCPKYSSSYHHHNNVIVGSTDSAGSIGTMGSTSSTFGDGETESELINDWTQFDDGFGDSSTTTSNTTTTDKLTSHLNSMNLVQIPLQPIIAMPPKTSTSRRTNNNNNDHLLIFA